MAGSIAPLTEICKLGPMSKRDDDDYEAELRELQIALVKTQTWAIDKGLKLVVIFEGRDAAGKDGTIARVVEHLSARNTRVVALPKPSDRQKTWWWFQRYVAHLPSAGEWVVFNRSWYNRSGVEQVMGFCTPQETEEFLRNAPDFERMLAESGIVIVKFWLDISRDEQKKRIEERQDDPLKQLKTSDLDQEAIKRWKDYSKARNETLLRTHSPIAPWVCVRADHKKAARLAVIQHLLHLLDCPHVKPKLERPDLKVLFPFEAAALEDGRLAK
jgi:polyphosphate kinase 2